MSTLLTLYIAVGVFMEERDLIKQFGDTYRSYKKEITRLIPKVF